MGNDGEKNRRSCWVEALQRRVAKGLKRIASLTLLVARREPLDPGATLLLRLASGAEARTSVGFGESSSLHFYFYFFEAERV